MTSSQIHNICTRTKIFFDKITSTISFFLRKICECYFIKNNINQKHL